MNNSELIEKKYIEAVHGIKEEWLTKASSTWFDHIMNLPKELQITYMVVILHNQVINGGFHQYFVNGYGQFAKETIHALVEIGALRKAELLNTALTIVNSKNMTDVDFREKLLKKEIEPLFVRDELFEPLDKLDSEYYETEEEDIERLLAVCITSR